MWFEYLIFVLIGLTQIYFCNGAIERYRSAKDAETTDGMRTRYRREAEPQFISNQHVHYFMDGSAFILERQTTQRNPTGRIISSQQHSQQHHGLPNNQYYQQQPQTFQRVHLNNAQKPREIIAHHVPTTMKASTLTEYDRSQFRRDISDNPFLNKEMPQNPFLTNRQINAYTTQNTPPATIQNPYMLNPFLQNTKIPNLSKQSQPTKVPATTAKPFMQIISSTPQSTTTTPKVSTINTELSQLIRNKAILFPDSIFLTRTTPSIEHILDIRR